MPGTELIEDAHTTALEQALDGFNADLPALEEFILPGGNEARHAAILRVPAAVGQSVSCCDFRGRSR